MIGECRIRKDLEGSGGGLIEIIFRHVPGSAEENTGNFQSGQPVSWPRYEESTHPIQV
jgi:hypothetical protein